MSGRLVEEQPGHRSTLVRNAALYTPPAAGALVLTAVSLGSLLAGNGAAVLGLLIMGGISFGLAFESIASLRDLRSSPVTTRGRVQRLWDKGVVLFFGRAHYMMVGGQVFTISDLGRLEISEDREVEVLHWPHTKTVITVHLLEGDPLPPPLPPRIPLP